MLCHIYIGYMLYVAIGAISARKIYIVTCLSNAYTYTDSFNARTSAPEVYYKLPKREHDQDHADHTHRKVEGRVEESPKKSTPLRYLSKKDSSGRGGEYTNL